MVVIRQYKVLPTLQIADRYSYAYAFAVEQCVYCYMQLYLAILLKCV